MIKIVEWTQNTQRNDEITVKTCLRGGIETCFQLDKGIVHHLPRFCVIHVSLKNRTEELLLCDFKKLKKISVSAADVRVSALTSKALRKQAFLGIELDGSYAIKHSESVDRPWLGPDGWQANRHEFEFPVNSVKDGMHPAELWTGKRKTSMKNSYLAAAAVFVVVAAISAPIVYGHLGSQKTVSVEMSNSDPKGAANHTASLDPNMAGKGKNTPENIPAGIQEEGPAMKVKEVLKSGMRQPKEKNHKVIAEKKNTGLSIPCTPDMAEKGISCY